MVAFAGYEMPLQYDGLRAEHLWTRENAGLFDVSHMGQVRARGELSFLEQALPIDLDGWPPGLQKYSLLLNENGGIADDLMVTRLEREAAIVVNAASKSQDLARLERLCPQLEFSLSDNALIALQGPRAAEALPEAEGLKFMHAKTLRVDGVECLISRSGYTGEDGFEISVPQSESVRVAKRLLANPLVRPVGLGARDTLRLEAGLHLYGQDMDASVSPREAGLAWAIAPSRRSGGPKAGGFPGACAVDREERRFTAFVGVDPVPVRHGADLVEPGRAVVGTITSGTVSPTLGKPVMLGYVSAGVTPESPLCAMVRGQPHPVQRAKLPFVPKRYKRT